MQIWNFQIRSPLLRYGLALALVPVSILFRYSLTPLLGDGYQYVTVFPVIVIAAIFAGKGPAVIFSILAGVAATFCFSPIVNIPALSGAVIVVLTGFLTGLLTQKLHDSLANSEAQTKALIDAEQ